MVTEQRQSITAERRTGMTAAQRRGMVMLGVSALVLLGLIVLLAARLISASQAASKAPIFSLDGKPAPDFTATIYGGQPGQTFHLAAEKGKPVVVNFFASWCVPCAEEAPILKTGWQTYGQRDGVVFIGIVYQDTEQNAVAFAQQEGIPYQIGGDPNGYTAISYGVTGAPETVFINREGVVVSKTGGAVDSSSLPRSIQAILR